MVLHEVRKERKTGMGARQSTLHDQLSIRTLASHERDWRHLPCSVRTGEVVRRSSRMR